MITIKNTQRSIILNTAELKSVARKMLFLAGYEDFDLGIWLTTNTTIRRYNKQYRNKDKFTDILSFPYHPNLSPGQKIKPSCPEDENLGDLIISLEYVKKDASNWDQTFKERMHTLLAHGIAHLLGYDHQSDKDYALMSKLEKKLLKATL